MSEWLNKTSLAIAPTQQQQTGIHPQTKVSLWEVWHQPYIKCPRRTHLPTEASGNIHMNLSLRVNPPMAHELAPALLGPGPGAPGKHCLRQSLTEKKAIRKVQVSSGEVQNSTGAKKYIYDFGHIRDFSHITPSPEQHSSGSREIFSDYDFPCGRKRDRVCEHPTSPPVQDTAKGPLFSCPIQKPTGNYIRWWRLSSPTVIITSQYISLSNQHIVQLKVTQCYMSIIS